MKLLVSVGCVAVLFYLQGCGGSIKNKNGDQEQAPAGIISKIPVPAATDNLVIHDEKDIIGYWAGEFGTETSTEADSLQYDDGDNQYNKINISIDEITGSKVKGHTVIQGKIRFFKCKMEKAGSKYRFSFKGGADEKVDGLFKFSITEGDTLLKGDWNTDNRNTGNHSYALTKKLFSYNPNWKLQAVRYVDFEKSKKTTEKVNDTDTYVDERFSTTSEDIRKNNASADVLTKENVENLKKADLLILRNSIFARHGYTFKKPLLSLFFSQQSWYVPISNDVTAELTETEKKNLELMKRYEKNAAEYYDAFGR